MSTPRVAIVDYGMGNLFSVRQACEAVGLHAAITDSPEVARTAAAIILPGVGGMPDAMSVLTRSGMAGVLREEAAAGKPLMGICLGLQLFMAEGTEFERHAGLGLIPGTVVRFEDKSENGRRLKVPHVGWSRIWKAGGAGVDPWTGTPLSDLPDGLFMYFVHSFYVLPQDTAMQLARARYGGIEFCCALRHHNVFGCQFHPERSGPPGLRIYKQFAKLVLSVRHP